MKINKSFAIYLPENFEEKINEIIEKFPPPIPKFDIEKLFYIVSLIDEVGSRYKDRYNQYNGYAIINATILRLKIYNYKEYLSYLIDNKIIECDNYYIPGEKSYGYKISDNFNGRVIKKYIHNPKLIKKISRSSKIKKISKSGNIKKNKGSKYNHLKKWFNGLEIDDQNAKQFALRQLEERKKSPGLKTLFGYGRQKIKDRYKQYSAAIRSIDNIKEKNFNFSVDNKGNRFHHALTRMPRDTRNFITWKGRPLGSLDIANSQPYLLSLLVKRSFYGPKVHIVKPLLPVFNQETPLRLLDFYNAKTDNDEFRKLFINVIYRFNKVAPNLTDDSDIKRFLSLVSKGSLYEFLQNDFKSRFPLTHHSRDDIKTAVMLALYTKNRFLNQPNAVLKRRFIEVFPNLYKIIELFKVDQHNFLPILMQRIEAKLILDIIVGRISKERPDIPLFTIHDSIVTTLENIEYVKQIMEEELLLNVGLEPTIKTEYWFPFKKMALWDPDFIPLGIPT